MRRSLELFGHSKIQVYARLGYLKLPNPKPQYSHQPRLVPPNMGFSVGLCTTGGHKRFKRSYLEGLNGVVRGVYGAEWALDGLLRAIV